MTFIYRNTVWSCGIRFKMGVVFMSREVEHVKFVVSSSCDIEMEQIINDCNLMLAEL